jgi:hypothetical protein
MGKPPVPVRIPAALLKRAIKAFEELAHAQAGYSQAPDLILPENTQEWKDAQALRRIMKEHYIK